MSLNEGKYLSKVIKKDTRITPADSLILIKYFQRVQPAFTWSKLTIKTLQQGVKYAQS